MPEIILKVGDLTVKVGVRTLLEGVHFTLQRKSILSVVGPNGAGKTTLFKALLNLIDYSGTVEWQNRPKVGYVPQSLVSTDIPISVAEFIGIKGRVDIPQCLGRVGLDASIARQRVSRLSGGQLQRVLLAWAISDTPDVLLFDEPTSLVDIGAEEPIYEMIEELREKLGVAVIMISHNMHIVTHYSDFILALNRKQLFFGRTMELSHSKLIALMSGIEARDDGKC